MQRLSVAAVFDRAHEDVLGQHEGHFLPELFFDDQWIDAHALDDVFVEHQYPVHCQKRFGDGDAFVRAVVQRPLHPLGARGHGGIEGVDQHIAPQRADALRAHGVALVGHGGGAHLAGFEGFVHQLHVGHQAHVGGEFHGGLGDAAQYIQNEAVHFAAVSLAAHVTGGFKAAFLGDQFFELSDLVLVAAEQAQKAGAGAGGALAAQQFQALQFKFEAFQVHHQILRPEARPLAQRGGLRRLKVRVGEGLGVLVLKGEIF